MLNLSATSATTNEYNKEALLLLRSSNYMTEINKWSCDIHMIGTISNNNPLVLVTSCLWNIMNFYILKEIKYEKFIKFMKAGKWIGKKKKTNKQRKKTIYLYI